MKEVKREKTVGGREAGSFVVRNEGPSMTQLVRTAATPSRARV